MESAHDEENRKKGRFPLFDAVKDRLIVFHPGQESWSFMTRKFSQSGVKNFLRENIQDLKTLRLEKMEDRELRIKICYF